MKRFAEHYPDIEKWQMVVAKISWSHNIMLLQKVKGKEERLWYAQKAIEHGRSKNAMVHHIESKLYKRQ